MSVIIVGLLVTILAIVGAVSFSVVDISLRLKSRDVDHAKCISHIAHYSGNQFAAKVLEAAAAEYESPEGQHDLKVIVQSGQYAHGGLPVPALWMMNRAHDLREEVK